MIWNTPKGKVELSADEVAILADLAARDDVRRGEYEKGPIVPLILFKQR